MRPCIICRKEKEKFSDEHVIPDSLKGYYHIYSVCIDCNSRLGLEVDNKLVNHKFLEFQRHQLGIRGKKGGLPNPLSGIGHVSDDPDQKVRIEMDEHGKFIPRLLPIVPAFEQGSNRYQFTIDKQDIHLKDAIIKKIMKRNGLNPSQVNFQEQAVHSKRPSIQSTIAVDISEFRIGMLKIAYEFTIDTFPKYFDDETAIVIADILCRADIESMEERITFFGNGFQKDVLKPLEHLIDFGNNNHYLVLMETEQLGLVCQVNLFHSFSIAIQMSAKSGYTDHNIIVGINDIEKCSFEKIGIDELVKRTHSPNEYGFQFRFGTKEEALSFWEFQNNTAYEYHRVNGYIPFFDRNGNIQYASIDDKLNQPHLLHTPEDDDHTLITKIELDEELFIVFNPGMRLVQVAAVRIITRRIAKI